MALYNRVTPRILKPFTGYRVIAPVANFYRLALLDLKKIVVSFRRTVPRNYLSHGL